MQACTTDHEWKNIVMLHMEKPLFCGLVLRPIMISHSRIKVLLRPRGFSSRILLSGKSFHKFMPCGNVGKAEVECQMSDAPIRQAKAKLNDVIVGLLLGSFCLLFRLPYWIH
jgi:hypothetical protein